VARDNFAKGIGIFTVCVVLFFSISTRFDTLQRRSFFLMCVLLYCFFRYSLYDSIGDKIKLKRHYFDIIDILLIALTVLVFMYLAVNSKRIMMAEGTAKQLEVFLGYTAIVLVLEGTRRGFGRAVVILAIVFLLYLVAGTYIRGMFHHPGFNPKRIVIELFLSFNGIFSIPLFVFLRYVFLFIFFGAILEAAGAGDFFMDFSKSLVGHVSGGPAKIAVVTSGLFGMVSGSTLANTLTTGAVTIPMMKKLGYDKNFAGGVESAASTGGPLMPPVMGATVFIMVEKTGISYLTICKHALVPAILYFLGIFFIVQFFSNKNKLIGLPRDQLPKIKTTLKSMYFFLPMVLLIFALAWGYSPKTSILFSIILLILLSMLRKDSRLINFGRNIHRSKLITAFENTAKRACPITAAGASIGIVLGVIGLTGVSLKISDLLLRTAGESTLLALILTMVLSIIFGMGMDAITVYILLSTLLVPGLIRLGLLEISSHLFVLYYGMMAMVTPPVCLAAYAAAGVAEANPFKTGFWGWRLALAGFLIPFTFAYNPALLLIGSPHTVLFAIATSTIGVIALAGGVTGYIFTKVSVIERVLLFISALLLIRVGSITDLIGIVPFAVVIVRQYILRRKLIRKSIE
jgi:TRAP transporter 4TM/12TM fusion protein